MRAIFLGKPLHWVLLAIVAVVLWAIGARHLHVTQFNYFVFITIGLALVVLSVVVFGHRPGERVMREPPEPHTPHEPPP